MCAQQGDFTLINLIMKPCFFKLVSNYNEGKKRKKNHREGKEVKVRDVDRSQSREAVVGGGGYIPELCCASAGVPPSSS